jgi:hypothetical protein
VSFPPDRVQTPVLRDFQNGVWIIRVRNTGARAASGVVVTVTSFHSKIDHHIISSTSPTPRFFCTVSQGVALLGSPTSRCLGELAGGQEIFIQLNGGVTLTFPSTADRLDVSARDNQNGTASTAAAATFRVAFNR